MSPQDHTIGFALRRRVQLDERMTRYDLHKMKRRVTHETHFVGVEPTVDADRGRGEVAAAKIIVFSRTPRPPSLLAA